MTGSNHQAQTKGIKEYTLGNDSALSEIPIILHHMALNGCERQMSPLFLSEYYVLLRYFQNIVAWEELKLYSKTLLYKNFAKYNSFFLIYTAYL